MVPKCFCSATARNWAQNFAPYAYGTKRGKKTKRKRDERGMKKKEKERGMKEKDKERGKKEKERKRKKNEKRES